MNKNHKFTRRSFPKTSIASFTALTIVPRYVLGGPGFTPPSEILTRAVIGTGGMGMDHVTSINTAPRNQHGELKLRHEENARITDQPVAALITDLKARGLLDDTLVLWAGEMGRTPHSAGADGRDHHVSGYTIWLAGGGIRGGLTYGATDDMGMSAVENPVDIHDIHATILHQLGMDHEELTFRFGGRDMRLTDVHGKVIRKILA
jgi:hypothetical protein